MRHPLVPSPLALRQSLMTQFASQSRPFSQLNSGQGLRKQFKFSIQGLQATNPSEILPLHVPLPNPSPSSPWKVFPGKNSLDSPGSESLSSMKFSAMSSSSSSPIELDRRLSIGLGQTGGEDCSSEISESSRSSNPGAFPCPICHKVLSSRGSLKSHSKIHSGEKPFACFCGKSFRTKDSLTKHSRVHTGEKPYSCETCGKSFTQNSSWRLHMRIHSGSRPFECEVCHRMFTQKGNLDAHRRIHTGQKPFSCEVCGKAFVQHSQLKKHIKTHSE
jgi:uncharacterized Zn-finger protein